MEKVSIVIPVYNVEEYLQYSVGSLRQQTYSNIEIILAMMDRLIDQEKFVTSMLRKMTVFECSIFKMGDCLMLEIQE